MTTGITSWRGLCRQQSMVAPLKLVPFLPQDNDASDGSGQDGSISSSSSSGSNSRANSELGRLLGLAFPTFLSFVLEDESLGKFVDTFLRFRRRHYESHATHHHHHQQRPSGEPDPLQELGRRVFLVLLRAVGPEHASLSEGESSTAAGSTNGDAASPGKLLVADGGMLSPPAVLDMCALYGRSNPSLVAGLLRSLGELDGGAVGVRLVGGLEETGVAAARALAEVHAKMAGAQDGLGLGPSIGQAEASDVLSYVVDVAVSIGSLLQASCGVGGGGGGDGIGSLALRLQGSDGEVSPEGLAAALALTFEATLPTLEGVLLQSPAPSSAAKPSEEEAFLPTGEASVRARGRLARQWLLRCLHWLVGPVFLQPLGLQEGESSTSPAEKSGNAGGAASTAVDGRVAFGSGVADGLFSFITSITAASGHLAPTGHAGTLLGEYNRRFRLADALDQAEALGTLRARAAATPGGTKRGGNVSAPSVESDGTGAWSSSSGGGGGAALGSERTEYLAGVLRALPVVSEEWVSASPAEAAAAAKASARAMSAALEKGDGRLEAGRKSGGAGGGTPPRDPEELDEMVKSVQAVLGGVEEPGGLGEGFVEACLSVLGWSPQGVIEAVLEDRLPPQVANLNRGLRRAWKGKKGDLDKAYRIDKDLAASEAKRLIAMEKRQEDDAYLLSREYDDDYDDQYDDREVDVGGGGQGGDVEAIRRVNQLVRQEEEEDAWWENNKNNNLSVTAPKGGGWRARARGDPDGDGDDEDEPGGQNDSGGRQTGGRGRGGGGRSEPTRGGTGGGRGDSGGGGGRTG
ncbi:unnamed protein product, partial [Scytosiphon promiscuus]